MSSQSLHRIGHGGASALVPANTLESFDVARSIGIDMIEFDLRGWRGELVLAHTILDAPRPGNVRLDEALSYLASRRFAEIELNVDLKHVGCEAAVLDALRRHGLLARTLISCQLPAVVDRVRALDSHARTGISIGGRLARLSRRWTGWRAQVLAGLAGARRGCTASPPPIRACSNPRKGRSAAAIALWWSAVSDPASPSTPITIVIADDHQVVRAGLRLLLDAEDGFAVVADAGDVASTERRVAAFHPKVLVLDVNMPE